LGFRWKKGKNSIDLGTPQRFGGTPKEGSEGTPKRAERERL